LAQFAPLNPEDLRRLLSQSEGITLEFKLYYDFSFQSDKAAIARNKDEAAKDLLALANSGGLAPDDVAYLVLGAGNERQPDGNRPRLNIRPYGYSAEDFMDLVNSAADPPLRDLHYEEIELDGSWYGVITIPPSPFVHRLKRNLRTKSPWQTTVAPVRHGQVVEAAKQEEVADLERRKTAWLRQAAPTGVRTGIIALVAAEIGLVEQLWAASTEKPLESVFVQRRFVRYDSDADAPDDIPGRDGSERPLRWADLLDEAETLVVLADAGVGKPRCSCTRVAPVCRRSSPGSTMPTPASTISS
jgi:hypothetical protein